MQLIDYWYVLDYIYLYFQVLDMLPRQAQVEKAVLDFELAIWNALGETLAARDSFAGVFVPLGTSRVA